MPQLNALGRHLIAELFDCPSSLLHEVDHVKDAMVTAAQKANATLVNVTFHHFAPFGVSGVVVIQESHLAIHTWPEYGYASVDIYTCGDSVDPWIALSSLEKQLQAQRVSCIELSRGQMSQLPASQPLPTTVPQGVLPESTFTEDIWFTERAQHLALSVRHAGTLLHREESPFQKIEVYQTAVFGKMLVLNGSIAITQQDENAYHEMLVHVPMLSHPSPKNILVIGGGDGGAIREVMRHSEVEKVTLVEVDKRVSEVCKMFFPSLESAFADSRLQVVNQDAQTFIAESQERFDVILMDANDPLYSSERAMESSFYQALEEIMKPNASLVVPLGSPAINRAVFRQNFRLLQQVFTPKRVTHYLAFTPSYLTGMWSFALIEEKVSVNSERQQRFVSLHDLKYYNAAIHKSAFHHPTFVKRLLQ